MLHYFKLNQREVEELIKNPLSPRQRAYHEIMWVQQGVADFIVDGDTFSVHANAFFIFPKGRIHQFLPKQMIAGEVIRFSEDILEDFPRLLFSKFNHISEIKLVESDVRNLKLLYELFASEYQLLKGESAVLISLLKTIILKLNAIKQKQFPCQKAHQYSIDTFDRFQMLLDKHVLEHKKVGFYAEKLNITPRKLGETIKSVLNKSTTDVIAERLLIACKRKLLYSNNTITEVAYLLGFEDNSYFTKFFKKLTSLTPKAYRDKSNIAI